MGSAELLWFVAVVVALAGAGGCVGEELSDEGAAGVAGSWEAAFTDASGVLTAVFCCMAAKTVRHN
jgi:hypothetical protein